MTIQEAIKSGKPVRRKAWAREYPLDWFVHPASRVRNRHGVWAMWGLFQARTESGAKSLMRDVLATDWEVKP